ncbi:MAG: dephospho-CoA kinase [Rhodospirillaceae bacterium]|nr:MAG: dephospho-CoA kinase [Rhodospirillaceae bacterium]
MYVLGLTGSIAMGKSWGATCFRILGLPVHDSDACVHKLLAPGGKAVARVLAAFPGVGRVNGGIDRHKLSASVFADDGALDLLELLLHPLVQDAQQHFLAQNARAQTPIVVLDIPLLFETRAQNRVDGVVVMTAPADLQYIRALARPNMTLDKLHAIMRRQMPDPLKCLGADFVIQTGQSKLYSLRQIRKVVKNVQQKTGKVWRPGWATSGT